MARTVSAADQDRLLGLLADGRWHRGEDLAQGFGISRAAIAGRVQKLAERGVDVSSEPGRGYRLAAPLSLLDAEAIRAAAGDTACRIEVAGWIDSTNARLLAADPAGDPQALVASRANAQANAVDAQLRTGLPGELPGELPEGRYPIILANILAGPLIALAPTLCAQLAPGGHLVLSGLLSRQVDEVCAAYAPWLQLKAGGQEDDWIRLDGQRPGG